MTPHHTFQKASITTEAVWRILAAAETRAREMGIPSSIAITDESGVLKAFTRMDGAALLTVQIAQDKAYTASSFGMATDGWHEFIKNDPPLLHGVIKTERLIIFGGGYPIQQDGMLIGGIGVSGGHYTQDMDIAQAGLAALERSEKDL
ncbi:MAG: heme-binding protein [Ktedonobacteraceae bacterium]|nr:heme-binding protein [Ktedonobacteraceae bacterium]